MEKKSDRRTENPFGHFQYEEVAVCPTCRHGLTADEIEAGFTTNVFDLTTGCPVCQTRFLAHLIISVDGEETERVHYICPDQTLQQMKELLAEQGEIDITYLALYNRQLYYNIVAHFGDFRSGLLKLEESQGS